MNKLLALIAIVGGASMGVATAAYTNDEVHASMTEQIATVSTFISESPVAELVAKIPFDQFTEKIKELVADTPIADWFAEEDVMIVEGDAFTEMSETEKVALMNERQTKIANAERGIAAPAMGNALTEMSETEKVASMNERQTKIANAERGIAAPAMGNALTEMSETEKVASMNERQTKIANAERGIAAPTIAETDGVAAE
ncbi:hypothetical protein [Candidatus Epulonipiscium viviparus]|uniref:hypothetical protein n=1 Tax=Candidatus Epulonipiscium viviparus TaxID=420336 RepID=UPI00273810FD|nr:hypothetical protein [Candidatus Epulopiscium viviparus]